ncbi:DUF2987 domain-containing protein [Paraglaciecola aquimarina]|uniref:DUF2987 domain-containing protein n=1 Tax=Paraglaciecola aquimarina TaxID=1235557 RepID=A0ABU3SYM0_9ALTE|nr:DUF2987 domain-containing protein [Paraglaciecola aquimarina]MDU0355086.1 DUF2987 domain-containing protein [Paraglaciecola aquimarina]
MIKYGVLLLLCCISWSARSKVLDVDYASFYSHVSKINKEETNKLRFAFGFKHIAQDRLCNLVEANIVTQKQTIPLTIENGVRFTVPTDKVLKMAKAVVAIEFADNVNQCDMSVQLETKPNILQQEYTYKELRSLLSQYKAFFANMGSFMSFMMPSATGLVMHFSEQVNLSEANATLLDKEGNLTLDQAWFEQEQGLSLPIMPLRITALVEK